MTTPFEFYGELYDLELRRTTYANGRLAVIAMNDGEVFADVTVNLPYAYIAGDDDAYVDENNLPGITKWLKENDLIRPVDDPFKESRSGFCTYTRWRFNVDTIPYTEEEEYLRSEDYVVDSVINGNHQQARELCKEYGHERMSVLRHAREEYGDEVAEKVGRALGI